MNDPKPGKLVFKNNRYQIEYLSKKGTPAFALVNNQKCSPKISEAMKTGHHDLDIEYFQPDGGTPIPRLPGEDWLPSDKRTPAPSSAAPPAHGETSNANAESVRVTSIEWSHDVPPKPMTLCLSDASTVEGKVKFVDVCEIATTTGLTLCRDLDRQRKYRRVDYCRDNPDCYPFNFVSAPASAASTIVCSTQPPNEDEWLQASYAIHPEMDRSRFLPGTHTGKLEVEMLVLSPTVVSHPPQADNLLDQADRDLITSSLKRAKNGSERFFGYCNLDGNDNIKNLQRIRPSSQLSPGKHFIPATSIKGMLRSVVEALSNSFMGIVSEDLRGNKDCGRAKIASRHKGRFDQYIASKPDHDHPANMNDRTIYTYGFGATPKLKNNWNRWVGTDRTPWAKLNHLIPSEHPESTTLADRMFGRVSKDDKYPSFAGRIRIGDAIGWDKDGNSTVAVSDDYWFLKTLTRPSGAKAKCEALYLEPKSPGEVDQYNNPKSKVRGRKVYWPHSLGAPDDTRSMALTQVQRLIAGKTPQECKEDVLLSGACDAFRKRVLGDRHNQPDTKSWVRPVLPGSRFTFKIRYENLSDVELGALIRGIMLFNDPATGPDSAEYCHRLGRAKPLGFGSVVLNITNVKEIDVCSAYNKLTPLDGFISETPIDALNACVDKFDEYCKPWMDPIFKQIKELHKIPDEITNYDYWKNWGDYDPLTAVPIKEIR